MGDAMTPDGVKLRLQEIQSASNDDETAHRLEDVLHLDVLVEIANDNPRSADLAREALRSRALKFSRWYA